LISVPIEAIMIPGAKAATVIPSPEKIFTTFPD